jgi:hypothetical protein
LHVPSVLEKSVTDSQCSHIFVSASAEADKVGSIKACYLLNRSNLIAVVGGGKRPKFAENSVLIFDDVRKEFVFDFTFSGPVLNVMMQNAR